MKKKRTSRRKKERGSAQHPSAQHPWPVEFPEVKGKTIEAIKFYGHVDDNSLSIVFSDKTQLNFDLEAGLTVRIDYSDWKTGDWRPIKCWPPLERDSFWLEEPCPRKS